MVNLRKPEPQHVLTTPASTAGTHAVNWRASLKPVDADANAVLVDSEILTDTPIQAKRRRRFTPSHNQFE
jgi:hypothetical protein